MRTSDFVTDATKRGGNFANWKKKGKIVFFIHPRSEIGKRERIMFRLPSKNGDNEIEIRSFYRFFKGKNDPTTQFLAWLRKQDNISNSDVVLRVQTKKEVEEYRKGDLLGSDEKDSSGRAKFDWRKKLLSPRTDYLFCIVEKDDPKGTQILNIPKSAGQKFAKLLQSQMEEYGKEGDPFENPWPVKLAYHENERASERYTVERHLSQPTEEHQLIFENEEPDDILSICDEVQDQEEELQSADLLKAMLVIPCPLFNDVVEEEEEVEEEKPVPPPKPKVETAKKKTGPKTTKTKPTKKRTAPKKKIKRKTKPIPKPEPEPEPEVVEELAQCPSCQRNVPLEAKKCPFADCGIEYDEEEEEEVLIDGDDYDEGDDIPF